MVVECYFDQGIEPEEMTFSVQIWADYKTFGVWPAGWPGTFPARIVREVKILLHEENDFWQRKRKAREGDGSGGGLP